MSMRKMLANAGSIASGEMVNRATTFLLYLLVARNFDETAYGQLALGLTFLYLAQVLAGFGLNLYLTREVAKRPDDAKNLLASSLALGLAASLLAFVLLTLVVLLGGYGAETRGIILLVGLTAVPFAIANACQGVFQGLERMSLVAVINVPAHLAKIAAALLLMRGGAPIELVVIVVLGTQVVIAGASLAVASRLLRGQALRPQGGFLPRVLALGRRSAPLMSLDVMIALWSSLPLVIVSLLMTEIDVGHFGAATQLLVPVSLLLNGLLVATFPRMSRDHAGGGDQLWSVTHGLLAVLLIIAVPAAFGIFTLAPELMLLVYGPGFEAGSLALRIMAPLLMFRAITSALGDALLAGMKERVTIGIVAVNCAIALALSAALIPLMGLEGAAAATLVAAAANLFQHYLPAARLLGGLRLLAVSWRPLVAATAMITVLAAGHVTRPLPAALVGAASYTGVLVLLYYAPAGSGGLRARFSRSWMRP